MNTGELNPVQPRERISEIDIIRGFALLGILMVNMALFKYPILFSERHPAEFAAGMEQAGAWFIQLLFTGKFYAIFSFLFGLGFYLFMERAQQKGLRPGPLYARRLAVLLAFGLLHLILLWSGDILLTYALAGFILPAFRKSDPAALKKWITAFFALAAVIMFALYLVQGAAELFLGEAYQLEIAALMEESFLFYREGSFLELTAFRLRAEIPFLVISLAAALPAVLGFFLCGLYIGKTGIFKDVERNLPLIRKAWKRGLTAGLLFSLLYVLVESGVVPVGVLAGDAVKFLLNYLGSIFLFQFYIASLLLLSRKEIVRKVLAPLAAAGRMALTNYLSQTIICVLLFNGFGLGLFGAVSLSRGILITLSIFLVQVLWSNLWMRAFNYGPVEWLWRVLTYKKIQPLRASAVAKNTQG